MMEINHEEWTDLCVQVGQLQVCNKAIKGDVVWIKEKMSKNRPTWATATIITSLTALCVGLIVHQF